MKVLRPILACAAIVAAVSCLDDRPLSPSTSATLVVTPVLSRAPGAPNYLTIPGVPAGVVPEIDIRAYTYGRFENLVELMRARIPVDTVPRRRELSINLLPCLALNADTTGGATPQDYCFVNLEFILRADTLVIDQQNIGSFKVRPGDRLANVPVSLTVGVNPPAMTLGNATLVDSGLVRYVLSASDPDGNLKSVNAFYYDSIPVIFGFGYEQFFDVRPTFLGPLYLFMTPPAAIVAPRLTVTVFDSKSATSPVESTLVVFPARLAPVASGVTATKASSGIQVNFTVTDIDTNPERVEVLFHSVPDSTNNFLDSLFSTCLRPIPQGDGPKSVSCAPFGQRKAAVYVIPFDKTNVGQAGKGLLQVP
jgi:hypothetical protein